MPGPSNVEIAGLKSLGISLEILLFQGGDSHMKGTGVLVVSLRGVNFDFGLAWGALGKISLAVKVSFRVAREGKTKKQKNFDSLYLLDSYQRSFF